MILHWEDWLDMDPNNVRLAEDIEMTSKDSLNFRRALAAVCFTLFALECGGLAVAQNEALELRNWWSPPVEGARERGKLSELVNKKKVYVMVSFTDSRTITEPSVTQSRDVRRTVLDAIHSHKELEIVPLHLRLTSLSLFALLQLQKVASGLRIFQSLWIRVRRLP